MPTFRAISSPHLISTHHEPTPDDVHFADHHHSYTILASCMHSGTRIVRLTRAAETTGGDDVWEFEVLAKFEEHESMNYGSDVQPAVAGEVGKSRLVVSTSFYDKLMCLWHVELGD